MSFNENHGAAEPNDEEVHDLVDLEEYGKRNEKPPKAHKYRIRMNKHHYVVEVSHMTGREILALASKTPAEQYKLQQKFHGQPPKVIGPDDVVDFTECGVERFHWFPLTETEG